MDQNANGAISESERGDECWTEKLNNRPSESEYKQTNLTALSRCARGVGVCVCLCVWRECAGRTRQTVQVCHSGLNLPSVAIVMGHLFIGKDSKVLLRNRKKSAQQMCREVNMFLFLSR